MIIYKTNHFFLQVVIPNGRYNGHTLIKLVNKNINARAKRINATVALSTLVKYNTIITTAIMLLIILSNVPMFLIYKIVYVY